MNSNDLQPPFERAFERTTIRNVEQTRALLLAQLTAQLDLPLEPRQPRIANVALHTVVRMCTRRPRRP